MESLFDQVLAKIKDGTEIVFTKDNVAEGDRFLIFSAYKKIKVTFHWRDLLWVDFDCDEPMLLEDCPDSFFESILKNVD